jgi:nucleoside-diphosphate-sugar epimerase
MEETLPLLEGVDCAINASGIAHVFRVDAAAAQLMREVNGEAAGTFARACVRAGVPHTVLVSSVSVYGSPGAASVDEWFPCRGDEPYSYSKLSGELAANNEVRGSATRLTILRPATIYGPGDRGNVARLIGAVQEGKFFWIGRGENFKSLIYRDDFARACIRAALDDGSETGINAGVYNVSSPPETMRAIVDAIGEALGRHAPGWHIPAGFARAATGLARFSPVMHGRFAALNRTVNKWLSHDAYSAEKFNARFGRVESLSLREGIRREVEWYVSRH